ncbi:MAG: integrase core domain-containing protein [Candidatus Dormibacteraceae bacterium]
MELLDAATDAGWSFAGACRELELKEMRAYRWMGRRDSGELADRAPGGSPLHGLLDDEVAEIVQLYYEWGEVDRSHRKLAHRGSYLERVWVSPSTVRRILAAQGLELHSPSRPGSSLRKPFPEWVEYRPNQLWIYDTTHFTRAKSALTVVEDLVSRTWIADILSSEDTSTQVEIVFTDALAAEGLLALAEERADTPVDPTTDDERRPILLAVSDIHTEYQVIDADPVGSIVGHQRLLAELAGSPTGASDEATPYLLIVSSAGWPRIEESALLRTR